MIPLTLTIARETLTIARKSLFSPTCAVNSPKMRYANSLTIQAQERSLRQQKSALLEALLRMG